MIVISMMIFTFLYPPQIEWCILFQVIATTWMQESPNVEHYKKLMSKYELKAKERYFDDLFRRQYPEHSKVAKQDRVHREEKKLDAGILSALAIGVGLDEEQVSHFSIWNKSLCIKESFRKCRSSTSNLIFTVYSHSRDSNL